VPAFVAVKLNVAPPAKFPLLKVVPSSEVTVWVKPSLFIQLTTFPTLTVVLAGKAIPAILMVTVLPPEGVGVGVGVTGVELLLDLLHERPVIKITASSNMVEAITEEKFFGFIQMIEIIKCG
jgi:hypothetical protein